MRLGEKQERFAEMVPMLLQYIHFLGYQVRIGDVFRDPRAHGRMGEAVGPYGHRNSNHKQKLAIDINLMLDGQFAPTEDHDKIHDFWDLLGGGERIPHDLNHYSLEHGGML